MIHERFKTGLSIGIVVIATAVSFWLYHVTVGTLNQIAQASATCELDSDCGNVLSECPSLPAGSQYYTCPTGHCVTHTCPTPTPTPTPAPNICTPGHDANGTYEC